MSGVRKLSGISTGIAQVGVITGPVLVMLFKNLNYSISYWMIFSAFLAASLPLFISSIMNTKKQSIQQENEKNKEHKKGLYIAAFSLIWPTLVIFNISAPLLAKTQYNSINIAGIMEVIIGATMAIAGFSHAWITKILTHQTRVYGFFSILATGIFTVYFFDTFKSLVFTGVALTGLSFGYFRVELRSFLSRRFSAKTAGQIVASANSWSAPLILLCCCVFYINSMIEENKGILIALPCIFIITGLIFCVVLLKDKNLQEEP